MAKQTITVIRRVKKSEKSNVPKGFHKCSSCGGTGIKQNVGRKPSK